MAVTWLVRASRQFALRRKTMFWSGAMWTTQDWDAHHFLEPHDATAFIRENCDTTNRSGWVFDIVPIDPSV